jgi:hypothetical protein
MLQTANIFLTVNRHSSLLEMHRGFCDWILTLLGQVSGSKRLQILIHDFARILSMPEHDHQLSVAQAGRASSDGDLEKVKAADAIISCNVSRRHSTHTLVRSPHNRMVSSAITRYCFLVRPRVTENRVIKRGSNRIKTWPVVHPFFSNWSLKSRNSQKTYAKLRVIQTAFTHSSIAL